MTTPRVTGDNVLHVLDDAMIRLRETTPSSSLIGPVEALTERIAHNQQFIAVFGAFSAGKSSLVNAIVGEQVLAVSPNPTTASVSRVLYGPNRRVHVVAKTRRQMWEDVASALAHLDLSANDLGEARNMAQSLQMRDFTPRQRKWVHFLKSFARGFDQTQQILDTEFDTAVADLRAYTADEATACFVDRVDLFEPAKALQSGVVVVDTPGVDSIHRRHADVAFRYVREADVVVFVLYYNHAFSRADRDFLQQLVEVERLLGQNKLVVVVNAVDLAASQDELQSVLQRVRGELRQLGITSTPVFPLSSQLALVAERWYQSGLTPDLEQLLRQRLHRPEGSLPTLTEVKKTAGFETFSLELSELLTRYRSRFIAHSLNRVFLDVADKLRARAALLRQQRQETMASHSERETRRTQVLETFQNLLKQVDEGVLKEEQAACVDWPELAFHAGERIRLKLARLFREAFYPGRFRNDAKTKLQLEDAQAEFADMLTAQFDIEVRTLFLRFEQSLTEAFADMRHEVLGELLTLTGDSDELAVDDENTEGEFSSSVLPHQVHVKREWIAPALKYFRTPRQFFEEGGQARAIDTVEELLLPHIKTELEEAYRHSSQAALHRFRHQCRRLLEQALEKAEQPAAMEFTSDDSVEKCHEAEEWFRLHAKNFS